MDWFTAPELAEASLSGMPSTARGMLKSLKKLAELSPDKSRQREGSKATEYHISILPPVVQAALLRKAGKVKVGGMTLDLPKDELESFASAVTGRFRNPYIKHQLLSISLNGMTKFRTRILPQLLAGQKASGKLPARLTFALAAD